MGSTKSSNQPSSNSKVNTKCFAGSTSFLLHFQCYLAFLFGFRQTKKTSVAPNALTQSTSLTSFTKCESEGNEVVFVCAQLPATEVVLFGKWGKNVVWRAAMFCRSTCRREVLGKPLNFQAAIDTD